jgi:hypothetical protein
VTCQDRVDGGATVTVRRFIDVGCTVLQVNVYRRDGSVLVGTVFNTPDGWDPRTSPEPMNPAPLNADMIIDVLLTPTLGLP